MGVIDRIILPPGYEQYGLLVYIIFGMLLFHLPFLGITLGTTGLSLAFGRAKPEMSRKLLETPAARAGSWLVFGIIPPLSLIFLFGQYLYRADIPAADHLARTFIPAASAFLLIFLYQRTKFRPAGALGLGLLALYVFFFAAVMDLIVFPGRWGLIRSPEDLLFTVTPAVHFLIMMTLFALVTGAAILFFLYRWPETRLSGDEDYHGFLKYLALGHIAGAGTALPALIIWDLFTLPETAVSTSVYFIALTGVVLLFFIVSLSLSMLVKDHLGHTVTVSVLVILFIAAGLFRGHTLQANGARDVLKMTEAELLEQQREIEAEREALYPGKAEASLELGGQVFNNRCTSCHAWDRRVVGPSYDSVMGKYAGNEDGLTEFILDPEKVDPDFPSMPDLGLKESEARSAARYLLDNYKGGS